jgi:hypothetical protein
MGDFILIENNIIKKSEILVVEIKESFNQHKVVLRTKDFNIELGSSGLSYCEWVVKKIFKELSEGETNE